MGKAQCGPAEPAHDLLVKAEVGGQVDEIPRGEREGVERRRLAAGAREGGRRPALREQPGDERGKLVLGLVAEEDVGLGVRGERVGRARVDHVLPALVEIGEHDRRVRVEAAQPFEERAEERIARRRPVEGRERDHVRASGRDARQHLVDRHAEADVAVVERHESRSRARERVDQRDGEARAGGCARGCARGYACLPEHRRGLHRAEVREVRIVDEIARDPERREHDRDVQHCAPMVGPQGPACPTIEGWGIESRRGWRGSFGVLFRFH